MRDPDAPPHLTASSLRMAFGGAVAMAVAMGIGRFIYTPILPGMMAQAGLSAADAGLIASSNYLGYLAGAVAAAYGWAAGRERMVMLVGLAASAFLAGAMALSDGLAPWLAIRFLAGAASAFAMIFTSTIVFSHLSGAGRDDLQSLHFGGVGLGIAVSSLALATLVIVDAQWEAGWIAGAVLSAAGLAVVAMLVRGGPPASGAGRREPDLVWSPALVRLTVAYGLFGAGYIVTATFLIAIVRAGEGGRLFEAAVWLTAGLADMPSVFVWRKLVGRLSLTSVYAVGCAVEALGVSASVMLGGVAGPLIGAVLLGGTFIAVTAFGLQAGRAMAGAAPRRALAFMTAAFGSGQILGPVAAGYLADWTGSFYLPSMAAAAVLLLSAAIAWSAGKSQVVDS